MIRWYFREGSRKYKFSWKELHHMWYGLVMLFLGFVGIFELWPMWVVYSLLGFGLWNVLDDAYQHIMQRIEFELKGYYTVRSFLHFIFYPKLWKNKL